MLLDILKYPDPFLKTRAEKVARIDDAVKSLINNMVETMYHAKGIGLAATQVGVAKRVAILDVPTDEERKERGKHLLPLINPEIILSEGTVVYEEGCLSIPGFTADVTRASMVVIRTLDLEGQVREITAEGLFAIALQHEIDHLDGILFIDRLSRLKREMMKRKIRKSIEAEDKAL
ncbi:MAG: peptide deformylase [Deltaproteobacteria bacterium GWB2_55_19]|nr:MAG: peptide deformylase [Deltaproteobacteria bacterium GWB2_55_19]HAO92799.1 peptide deformylase [Deltaproteobacteria bacterium]